MKTIIHTIFPPFAAISLITVYGLFSYVQGTAHGQSHGQSHGQTIRQAPAMPAPQPTLDQSKFGTTAAMTFASPDAYPQKFPATVQKADNRVEMRQVSFEQHYDEPPPMVIDLDLVYHATLQTVQGDIKIKLFDNRTPITVNNFVYLARDGYYDNTTFHRVIDGFMAQGGDPTGTGSGGPGYAFEDEIVAELTFDRAGLLAMANSGPGTNGSQFFITFAPTSWLNGDHTIFGQVVEGIERLDELTRRDPGSATTPGDEVITVLIEESEPLTFEVLLPFVIAN